MNEINKINLSEQTKFRLSEIIWIENYFHEEIHQTELCSKKVRKYVMAFDYIDKILIVLSETSCRVCITSWKSKHKFYFNFFSNNRNNQKVTKHNKKQKEKARYDSCVG